MTLGRTLSPSELVSGFIPPVTKNEARPTKPRFRVKYQKSFRLLSGTFFGDPFNYRNHATVDIEVPNEAPPQNYRDGIHYHETDVIADNVFEVPDQELVEWNDATADKAERFKEIMYGSAATLNAMDAASDYVGAALNDGLDLGLDMDDRPFAAFVHLSRLEVLSGAVGLLNISEKQKRLLLGHLTRSLADKAVEAMASMDKGDKISRLLAAQMHAVVKPQSHPTGSNLPAEDEIGGQRLGYKRARL